MFYISERGRYFPDNTRDKGRHLSAGFHNLMGYFRDDLPLYRLVLDEKGQKELDELWRELDFIASANIRTYVQWFLFESGESKLDEYLTSVREVEKSVEGMRKHKDRADDQAAKQGRPAPTMERP